MKIRKVSNENYFDVQNREDFMPVCQYGKNINIMENEIGSIVEFKGKPKLDKELGIFTCDVNILERVIFNNG